MFRRSQSDSDWRLLEMGETGPPVVEDVRLDLQDCLFCAAVMVGVFRVAYLKNDAIVG